MVILISQLDLKTYKHLRYYFVEKFKFSDKDFHKKYLSFYAFFNYTYEKAKRKLTRNYCVPGTFFLYKFLDNIGSERDVDGGSTNTENDLLMIYCKDLWDFYDKIGYDRKTKKLKEI